MLFKVYATSSIKKEAKKFNKETVYKNGERYFIYEINSLEEYIAFKEKAGCEVILLNSRTNNELIIEIYNAYRE